MHQAKSLAILFCCFDHILSYTLFYLWYIFCMCVGYMFGRKALQDGEKHSLKLFLIECYCVLCKLCYESLGRFI